MSLKNKRLAVDGPRQGGEGERVERRGKNDLMMTFSKEHRTPIRTNPFPFGQIVLNLK